MRMKRILVMASLALSLVVSLSLAQNDLSVGTWKLNVAKSQYTGTPAPKSETRTLVAEGNGYKVSYEGIAADGNRIGYSFTTYLDGKDSPISGAGPFGADTVAVKRVDAYTMTGTVKKAGKEIRTTTTVVSKDGKVTTQTVKGINEQGQPISYTMVWEKQ
jgi:hypothetical protein